jgi:hypothetical protein
MVSIRVFLMTRSFYWYQSFWPLDLEVWSTFQKLLTLHGHIFWMVSDKVFIFYLCSLWQHLSSGSIVFNLLTLRFDLVLKIFNICYIFWMISDRDIICVFHMTRPFLLGPKFLTWSWPWSLTNFLKTLMLALSFE